MGVARAPSTGCPSRSRPRALKLGGLYLVIVLFAEGTSKWHDLRQYFYRMGSHTDVFSTARVLRDELERDGADVVDRWGTSATEFSERLGSAPDDLSYQYIPEFCRRVNHRVTSELGATAAEAFLRLVACHQILALEARLAKWRLPATVVRLIDESIQSLLNQARSGRVGYFRTSNEFFIKDLAVCRLKLLPCGAELVDTNAGFARSLLWRGTVADGLRFGWALAQMGSNSPTLLAHWDRRAIGEFHPEGYRRFYRTVAELMELNPRYRGLCGESWWFDPQLSRISPELAFLREESCAAGAVCVPVETDDKSTARALHMSAARKAAYDRGEYTPRSMFWLWPRRALLNWAARSKP